MARAMKAIDWFSMIALPNALRSCAYCSAYSYAARATPTAWAPTAGRVASNAVSYTHLDVYKRQVLKWYFTQNRSPAALTHM